MSFPEGGNKNRTRRARIIVYVGAKNRLERFPMVIPIVYPSRTQVYVILLYVCVHLHYIGSH